MNDKELKGAILSTMEGEHALSALALLVKSGVAVLVEHALTLEADARLARSLADKSTSAEASELRRGLVLAQAELERYKIRCATLEEQLRKYKESLAALRESKHVETVEVIDASRPV